MDPVQQRSFLNSNFIGLYGRFKGRIEVLRNGLMYVDRCKGSYEAQSEKLYQCIQAERFDQMV